MNFDDTESEDDEPQPQEPVEPPAPAPAPAPPDAAALPSAHSNAAHAACEACLCAEIEATELAADRVALRLALQLDEARARSAELQTCGHPSDFCIFRREPILDTAI